jgi:hypothetical protein
VNTVERTKCLKRNLMNIQFAWPVVNETVKDVKKYKTRRRTDERK